MLPVLVVLLAITVNAAVPPTCDSEVYCQGPLLHTIQMARIFNDSKTFVDLKMRTTENETLENFNKLMDATQNQPTGDDLRQFVTENFEDGQELETWNPPDFKSDPSFLKNITDPLLQEFGKNIVGLWKILARKNKPEVVNNQQQYSLIPLPNGFIIPGGRFKEIYYWDSYWIIKGLLISEMHQTAKGMIENLLYLVKKLGHVPNGSRIYYTQRSQPPFLTKMVAAYMEYTKDLAWLKANIKTLEEELLYWFRHRSVWVKKDGASYRMFRYNAASKGPRPESYREDFQTASSTKNPEELYVQLKSAAESGWDFSSRWIFDKNGSNNGNLTQIHTTNVIPVDLNAILYEAFSNLAELYKQLNEPRKALRWLTKANYLNAALTKVLWNDKQGIWMDYDLNSSKHRDYFYPSNIYPLLTNCCTPMRNTITTERILKYLIEESGLLNYPGGIPTSLIHSGEQWDLPNAWPPLQSIVISALENANHSKAHDLAFNFTQNWVRANLLGFNDSKEMFEKYDAEVPGRYGGGGEYTVQAGFGWTNGVILELLESYGNKLTFH